ncbi:MAG: prepilin-type N-terminal cleavage/methylation domain-containing protein [Thermodesulfovibrionales bacterium]|nr:prepilin-type N-terminal cleavage/methylation domain-containing protein [Thermodesulfovibrionales bacterium]
MKNKRFSMNQKGFSLIEMLIAIAVGLIIMGAVMLTTRAGMFSSVGIQANVGAQQDVRLAVQIMSMEIAMASYKQTKYGNNIWADLSTTSGQNCSVLTSAPTDTFKRGIREATSNSITIEADLNNDGIIGSTGQQNEVIRYVLVTEGTNQYITRCTCCTSGSTGGGGFEFLGDKLSQGSARAVKVKNADLGIPLFRYYYANGQEFTPDINLTTCNSQKSGTPNAHFCNISRIDINIAVETADKDPLTGKNKIVVMSTSVVPRNHQL